MAFNYAGLWTARNNCQNARISMGEANGSINPFQAQQLRAGDAAIGNQISEMRAANAANGGGYTLTAGERQLVNREYNQESQAIYAAQGIAPQGGVGCGGGGGWGGGGGGYFGQDSYQGSASQANFISAWGGGNPYTGR
jgi:hypothetical protein